MDLVLQVVRVRLVLDGQTVALFVGDDLNEDVDAPVVTGTVFSLDIDGNLIPVDVGPAPITVQPRRIQERSEE